jgi:hypothetical protein
MMTQLEMLRFVSDFTYKPGYEIDLEVRGFLPYLMVRFEAPSSRTEPGDTAHVKIEIPIFEEQTEDSFRALIKRMIIGAELHECDEWLRYKGELIFDPHGNRGENTEFHFRKLVLEDVYGSW